MEGGVRKPGSVVEGEGSAGAVEGWTCPKKAGSGEACPETPAASFGVNLTTLKTNASIVDTAEGAFGGVKKAYETQMRDLVTVLSGRFDGKTIRFPADKRVEIPGSLFHEDVGVKDGYVYGRVVYVLADTYAHAGGRGIITLMLSKVGYLNVNLEDLGLIEEVDSSFDPSRGSKRTSIVGGDPASDGAEDQ